MTNAMTRITHRIATAALALCTLAATACDKDKKEQSDPQLTLQNVTGQYVGTFDFTPAPSDINPNPQPETGLDIAFEITEGGAVHFPEFPAAALVKALLGDGAEGLIPLLGTITYDATIGTPAADAERFTAPLTTPQLRIDLSGVMVVLISIEAPEQLVCTKSGEVTFTLKTTKCQLGEGESAGEPFDLVNTLKFTARKE